MHIRNRFALRFGTSARCVDAHFKTIVMRKGEVSESILRGTQISKEVLVSFCSASAVVRDDNSSVSQSWQTSFKAGSAMGGQTERRKGILVR